MKYNENNIDEQTSEKMTKRPHRELKITMERGWKRKQELEAAKKDWLKCTQL